MLGMLHHHRIHSSAARPETCSMGLFKLQELRDILAAASWLLCTSSVSTGCIRPAKPAPWVHVLTHLDLKSER